MLWLTVVVFVFFFSYCWIIGDWWRVLWNWINFFSYIFWLFGGFVWSSCGGEESGLEMGTKQLMSWWCVGMVQDKDPLYLKPALFFSFAHFNALHMFCIMTASTVASFEFFCCKSAVWWVPVHIALFAFPACEATPMPRNLYLSVLWR